MAYYRRVGDVPPKRHTRFDRPEGGLYAEELMGSDGFSGASALLYHRRSPSALVAADAVVTEDPGFATNDPLLPYHLRTTELEPGGDLVTGRRPLLGNPDVRLSVAAATAPSPLFRDAVGDELVYLRSGSARLETTFGALDCGPGDHVLIPTSTTHRWVPTSDGPVHALVIESRSHIGPPARYRAPTGQLLEHSPYCERDLHAPTEPLLVDDDGPVDVLVRHQAGLTRHRLAHHPFDVVGWDGYLHPYRFDVADFEPITGRIHQPPPVHQTFAGQGFVVCAFVPRKLDYHPRSIPAPYHHANVDSDEVLYYCDGDFTSRQGSGIAAGSISLHPAGFIHGPQPGSVEASIGVEATTELAIMVDTFRPLELSADARGCDDPSYPWSWSASS
ncbi:MAG: homogentisate 1,2-dioxygenase [Acidimicrobiales bacterium]|nr:homogentisate 1,2-dioxygenase [Acidimicrobiales bacterium]